MLYQIMDGSVSLGGRQILSHIDFEIKGNEKIAVTGRNGAGKTTLLRLLAGELELDRDDKRQGPGIVRSRQVTVGMLRQNAFSDAEQTVEEELLKNCPGKETFSRERFVYEQEYDRLFTGFGFAKQDKRKQLKSFSGGEQTKIALIRLLLEQPDILLLDEPTNHLDIAAAEWLEEYLKSYAHAVVMVSHDRFFLDQVAEVVVDVENRKLTRYPGNYTRYRQEKRSQLQRQQKAWERGQQEKERLEQLIERFKHKPSKAAFARAKKKQLERMEFADQPVEDDVHLFTGEISPLVLGSKWVFEGEHVKIGYDRALLELSLRIRRGQKIGLLGENGVGKSTFLKTVAGLLQPLAGKAMLGNQITIGYFDQHSAAIQSEKTVLEHFHDLFPAMTEKEVRSVLGAYLFPGKAAAKRVSDLSGGEKARLVLAELLQSRPNFLVLDEPTNHMDIQAKETLESAFRAYTGTILFVSHDRYFIRQVAESILIFEGSSALYYPFGYEHYLERSRKRQGGESIAAQVKAEDAALIEGIRAVPKAERHRLREIPTEEAYRDWKLRLAYEKVKPWELEYARAEERVRRFEAGETEETCAWRTRAAEIEEPCSRRPGIEEPDGRREDRLAGRTGKDPLADEEGWQQEHQRLLARREQAWERWHEACMEWYELLLELDA